MLCWLLACAALVGVVGAADAQDWHTKYTRGFSQIYWACQRETGEGDHVYTRCAWDEYRRRDGELNAAYTRLMAVMAPEAAQGLRNQQRAWIKRRDAICEQIRMQQPGTNALHLIPQCLADQTIRRTIWLEKLR